MFWWIYTTTVVMFKLQSNPVNTGTEGAIESVHINGVSVLSGLNLEKM